MGGEIPVIPAVVTEPTVAEWNAFMTALATAGVDATVSMVIQDGTNPAVADFRVPAHWIKVEPRFDVVPPVVDPPPVPPPSPVTLYVTSTNGMWTHNKADTTIASRVGSLAFRAPIKVNPDPIPAGGYVWRIIASGEPAAGLFIAEKTSDGATVYLSATQPNP